MRRVTTPSLDRKCQKCGLDIPSTKRAVASYCSDRCRKNAEKAHYKKTHPDYVIRQNALCRTIRHLKEYGHTRFIDSPLTNTKDKFRLARSLGFRSMLEYSVAKQLTDAGINFKYEKLKITYMAPISSKENLNDRW